MIKVWGSIAAIQSPTLGSEGSQWGLVKVMCLSVCLSVYLYVTLSVSLSGHPRPFLAIIKARPVITRSACGRRPREGVDITLFGVLLFGKESLF